MVAQGVVTGASSSVLLERLPQTLLFVCLGWFVINSIRSYTRLRHIPGPLIASFTSWWWVHKSVSGKGHLALSNVCDRYGMLKSIAMALRQQSEG